MIAEHDLDRREALVPAQAAIALKIFRNYSALFMTNLDCSGLSRFFGIACLTEPGFVHRTIAKRLKRPWMFIRAMVRCYEAGAGVARPKNRDKPERS
ncbi:hypothetical protein [Desulfonatronum parangueonense]